MVNLQDTCLHQPCDILSLSNEPLGIGRVIYSTEDCLRLERLDRRELPIFKPKTILKLLLHCPGNTMQRLVGTVGISALDLLSITELKDAAAFEKREYIRIYAGCNATLQIQRSGSHILRFSVQVQDVSLSGLRIKTDHALEKGEALSVYMELYGETVCLPCTITRIQQEQDSSFFFYGCAFVESKGRPYNLLCQYIFELQREKFRTVR